MFFERVFLFASVIGLETKINLVDNFLYFHSFIIFSIHKKTATKKHKLLEKNHISILSSNIGVILCPFVFFHLAQFKKKI